MTDAQRIYRSLLDFIDQQTAGLPPEIGLKMVRSYVRILAEPDEKPVAIVHVDADPTPEQIENLRRVIGDAA